MTPNKSETQRCIRIAWEHISTKTLADGTVEEFALCMQSKGVVAAESRLNHVAGVGDVLATQKACQLWNLAYKTAIQTLRQEHAA